MMVSQSSTHPSTGESLSIRVVRELAAHDGVDPMNLSPPLFESVDPAALDALFEPTSANGPRSGRVTFDYDGKRVTVESDGEITIDASSRTERQRTR